MKHFLTLILTASAALAAPGDFLFTKIGTPNTPVLITPVNGRVLYWSGTTLGNLDIAGTYQTQAGMSSYLTTATAASTYAPISTTATLSGAQTFTGLKTFNALTQFSGTASFLGPVVTSGGVTFGAGTTITYGVGGAADHRIALELGALATVTPGTGVATALAVNTGSTGAVALQGGAITATTVTASGSITVSGNATIAGSSGDIAINASSGSGFVVLGSTGTVFTPGSFRIGGTTTAFNNSLGSNFRFGSGTVLSWSNVSTAPAGGNADVILARTGTATLGLTGNLTASGTITGSNFKRGTGSPESVVTGSVGDLYTRTDGGAGTTLYVKESGTGNTGWVAK